MKSEAKQLHPSEVLLQAAYRLLALASLDKRIDCIMETLQESLGWDHGWLGLVDKEAGVLRKTACFGEKVPPEVIMNVIPLDPSIQNPALFSIFEKKPIVVDDPSNDLRCHGFRDSIVALGIKCFVDAPILVHGEVAGVICVGRTKEPVVFTAADVELLMAFASLAGLAIENAHLYERARELSLTDELTGLPNIRFLREQITRELARSQRSGQPLSILMVDVDKLKCVNDRFGHQVGDELLKSVGQAIRLVLRLSDVVVRYGGDEFVVLLPAVDAEAAYGVAKRMAQSIAKLAPVKGEIAATVGIGIASYPKDGGTHDEVLRAADEAMLQTKQAGGNHILSYQGGEGIN